MLYPHAVRLKNLSSTICCVHGKNVHERNVEDLSYVMIVRVVLAHGKGYVW